MKYSTEIFESAMTEGPKYKVVKLNKYGAAESIGIMHATYRNDKGCYHFEAVIRAFEAVGKPVAYDPGVIEQGIKARTMKAVDYLDELGIYIYKVENGTLSITGLKDWI